MVFFDSSHILKQIQAQAIPLPIIGLSGPLGVGKTTLVQELAQACGVAQTVQSPSFGLYHIYPDSSPPFLHADFYRLSSSEAQDTLEALLDLQQQYQAWLWIEWPERVPHFQPDVQIQLAFNRDYEPEQNPSHPQRLLSITCSL